MAGRDPGSCSGGELLVHGTCVAISGPGMDAGGALLRGAPGSGKSDLALRFISLFGGEGASPHRAQLVSDDQVLLWRDGNAILARPPGPIAGQIEVRGVGIVEIAHGTNIPLTVIVDLVSGDEVARIPEDPLPREDILGVPVPVLKLDPFELSCPVKLKLALTGRT